MTGPFACFSLRNRRFSAKPGRTGRPADRVGGAIRTPAWKDCAVSWPGSNLNVVRLRQIADEIRHRLLFVPLLYVAASVIAAQITLMIDRELSSGELPEFLTTTVPSSRAVLAAIAGGLIAAITLLMSITLVAVQLASSQFSPRSLRSWLGNSVLQHTIGLSLGTTFFCLLGLRSARSLEGSLEIVPHTTVLVGLVLGLTSLVFVVRSVDHVTHSLQVSSVAQRLTSETIDVITTAAAHRNMAKPIRSALPAPDDAEVERAGIPADAVAIEAGRSGWIQQIDSDLLMEALPEDSVGRVVPVLGGFVLAHSPLLWLSPPPSDDDRCWNELRQAFAIGESRTMQQDVGFGLTQLTDIAVRALSPGVNDPRTAMDLMVHIGDVLRVLWENEMDEPVRRDGSKTLVRREPKYDDFLRIAVDPVRRYATDEPDVMISILRTLDYLLDEVERRNLPGPVTPIRSTITDVAATASTGSWTPSERAMFEEAAQASLRSRRAAAGNPSES